jgi:hypothetical protein
MRTNNYRFFKILCSLLLIACTFIQCSRPKKNIKTEEVEYVEILTDPKAFNEHIVKPEALAWKKVAKGIYPQLCDDTETEWAAQQADSIADELIMHGAEKLIDEQNAMLSEIQDYILYGVSYLSAMMGLYSNPTYAHYLLGSVEYTEDLLDSLRLAEFKKDDMFWYYQILPFNYFNWFITLNAGNQDEMSQYVKDNREMLDASYSKIDAIYKSIEDKEQAYRNATIIINTTFFMTYCPMTFLIRGPEYQQEHQNEYSKMGEWLDNQAETINIAYGWKGIGIDNYKSHLGSLPPISDAEFAKFLKQAAEYRTMIVSNLISQ